MLEMWLKISMNSWLALPAHHLPALESAQVNKIQVVHVMVSLVPLPHHFGAVLLSPVHELADLASKCCRHC